MAVKDPFELQLELNRGFRTVGDDGDVAMEVYYVGDEVDGVCTVAVADATGDIAFVVDGSADTTIQVGSTAGTIDVSDTDADTLGEVIDVINASPNWRAIMKHALRADSADDTLLTMAASDAKAGALSIYKDTTAALNVAIALTEQDVVANLTGDQDTFSKVWGIDATSTYASGTSTIEVYACVVDKYGVTHSETKIYSAAGGNTTVKESISFGDAGLKPLDRDLGYKLLVRLVNSVAMASTALQIDATKFRFPRG